MDEETKKQIEGIVQDLKAVGRERLDDVEYYVIDLAEQLDKLV